MLNGWYYCNSCLYDGKCERQKKILGIVACRHGTPNEKFTNGDRIRNMNNAELLKFLNGCATGGEIYVDGRWIDNIEKWLESECDAK